ncbi:MAG: aminotransferase class III-fold pyridoxal phosphate-dependent enzyme [Chloroflexota bacterium]|nr:MAG: aminotransferase class III-fold pyridoxal phosphate-dependent enzyme [Chloroflexota bacterium]
MLPHLSPVWPHYTPILASRAEGSYVYDQSGNAFLDFTCGIGVTNTGHCHPKVVEAIRKQAELLIHGQINIIVHEPILELTAELKKIVPPEIDGFYFSNSGAEAIEGAIKLAKRATGRTNVIAFQGSFHGRTVGTMSLTTSKTIYRAGYQPLMPGVYVAPYPYAYRYGWSEEQTSQWCLEELEFLLLSQTAPEETAAILIEPVLGEGGYVVPPADFMVGLRDICDKYDILMIADEVQSGFGRTGKWFAFENFNIEPDIIVVAKGIASGLPLSGIFSSLELMEKWEPGSHGGTYGGNAVACAAAAATIRVIEEEGLLDNTVDRGSQLLAGLGHLQEKYPGIGDVRGLGLMVGTEFRSPDRKPNKKAAKAVIKACLDEGLILLSCGTWDNTVRWIPPLNVDEGQITKGLEIFEKALEINT